MSEPDATPRPAAGGVPAGPRTGAAAGARIRRLWDRLSGRPGGKRLFSWLVGRMAPYTGTIGARVEELREGYARLTLRDRRRVRNHLRSVHAVAQLNLAEEASGLAVSYSMPPHLRGIPVRLEIDYLKKARGTITAVSELPGPIAEPAGDERADYEAPVVLTDSAGDVVSRARARWVIGR
ncbi:MAG TPA: hotdog fold domain-containing protein [Thermoanaerobaculia bacterium]|nr:hotdog fold domain-containing protein [Thermoanaerobaculia bacterium]